MTSFPTLASSSRYGKSCRLPSRENAVAGFTLVESLVVLGIIAILTSILIVSLSGIKGSRDLNKAAYDIQGVLEQARTVAMASGTYTWVGFFEESPGNPGVAGTGQVVISIVSSADGTRLNCASNPSTATAITYTSLNQVAKLLKIANMHLDTLNAAAVTRPSVPTATYQVANSSFQNFYYFAYPIGPGVGTYQFKNIIQFNPQGDATRIADSPTQVMEIGLRPSHGTTVANATADVAAVQIAGIGGHVTTYFP